MAGDAGLWQFTDDYVRSLGRVAYLWGWPLVNMHNRLAVMEQMPEPALLGGIVPVAPPGRVAMLHDYVEPAERVVACPNQDVVYGFGLLDGESEPSVLQVPDFGGRFWVYQVVDQRTDSFVRLGAMYGSKPGFYLLAPESWHGSVPDGIADVFRFDTRIAVCIPRVFMDDTSEDRDAIQPLINQIMLYPVSEYSGDLKMMDWATVSVLPAGDATAGDEETQWVAAEKFFDELPVVMREVPARPGEEALYAWIESLIAAAADDERIADLARSAAVDANETLVAELFEFRNIGIPVGGNWTTQRNGAEFRTDYLSRTAMGKANIFVNAHRETAYFYQDLDETGERLHGSNAYAVTFPADGLPPVKGFWSLTLYNEHHFFHPNELNRYSLGTKNKSLRYGSDGSLTIHASHGPPSDDAERANWLPAPNSEFSLYLRAYWPDQAILDGTWTAPPATRLEQ